jgi:hypothetical protein
MTMLTMLEAWQDWPPAWREKEEWAQTRDHILRALAGDPVAVAQNYNIVKQLERRERED